MTSSLQSLFDAQRAASRTQAEVPLDVRRDRLQRVQRLLERDGAALSAAVNADFGNRSAQLTEVADLMVLRATIAG